MTRQPAIFLVMGMLAGCAQDHVVEVLKLPSPDGRAVAVYRQYQYGGAAGGVGHCISLHSIDTPPKQIADGDCDFLASSVSQLGMNWQEDILRLSYRDASITRFRNEAFIRADFEPPKRYEIRLVAIGK